MRDLGGPARVLHRPRQVVREVAAYRCHAHRRAVAEGAVPLEQLGGRRTPQLAAFDLVQQPMHGRPVAAVSIVVFGESSRQVILIDAAVLAQHGHDRERHLGIVGVGPGAVEQPPARDQLAGPARMGEELATEWAPPSRSSCGSITEADPARVISAAGSLRPPDTGSSSPASGNSTRVLLPERMCRLSTSWAMIVTFAPCSQAVAPVSRP